MFRKEVIFIASPLIVFSQTFKYHVFLQGKLDYGDLFYNGRDYQIKNDLYIRRFGLKLEFQPVRSIKTVAKIEGANLFRNYKSGKSKNFPNKFLVKKLYIRWDIFKNFSLEIGRDKKPFSREGLVSSEKLLLVDKTSLTSEVEKFFGDYYANQVEVIYKPVKSAKLYLSTFYGWYLRDENPFGKKLTVKPNRYWLKNFVGRFEFSPPSWEERKKDNTTFGRKTITFGVSYAYIGSLEVEGKRALGYADGFDIFFRSPKTSLGVFTAFAEYDRLKYLLAASQNFWLEGFQFQFGFRPKFEPFKKPVELALGFEKLEKHPSETVYRYSTNLNWYPSKHFKVALGVEEDNNLKLGKAAIVETLMVQCSF